MYNHSNRPVFLNLFQIRLPIAGIMSIAHRISGVIMFLSIPLALFLLERSLASAEGYAEVLAILNSSWLLPVYAILLWSLFHHLLAGIRYLLIDIDIGVLKPAYRKTALSVLLIAPLLVLVMLVVLL